MSEANQEATVASPGASATSHTHVDDWLDDFMKEINDPNLAYAKFVIAHFRQPAVLRMRHDPYMKAFKLFCKYKGVMHRVTLASCMGDIGITTDFTQETGYENRIFVDEVESWHTAP